MGKSALILFPLVALVGGCVAQPAPYPEPRTPATGAAEPPREEPAAAPQAPVGPEEPTLLLSFGSDADKWRHVEFSPDGAKIFAMESGGPTGVWDANTGEKLLSLPEVLLRFSPDGTRMILTAEAWNAVGVWDIGGKQLFTLTHPKSVIPVYASKPLLNEVESATFSPDGARIFTATCCEETAIVWDASKGKRLRSLDMKDILASPEYSPDGTRIAATSMVRRDWRSRRVDCCATAAGVWDARSGKQLFSLSHQDAVVSVDFSPDGARLLTASRDKTARVFDASSGRELLALPHEKAVVKAEFSPDGAKLLTLCEGDPFARIFDASSGEELLSLEHAAELRRAGFSPDGTRLLTASADGIVTIWDARSGAALFSISGVLVSTGFSPDGTRLLTTTSEDGAAKLWELREGAPARPGPPRP